MNISSSFVWVYAYVYGQQKAKMFKMGRRETEEIPKRRCIIPKGILEKRYIFARKKSKRL